MNNLQHESAKKYSPIKILWIFAAIVFFVSSYFFVREPVSFFWVIPLSLLVIVYVDKWNLSNLISPIFVILICVFSLLWMNSKLALFGEEYDTRVKNEEIIQKAKEAENKQFYEDNLIISSAEIEIERLLKDPDSATYTNEKVSSKSGVDVACGYVTSKNSFGGLVKQRYISNGIASGTFLEENIKDFNQVWSKFCY